jgi:hypothetical protein
MTDFNGQEREALLEELLRGAMDQKEMPDDGFDARVEAVLAAREDTERPDAPERGNVAPERRCLSSLIERAEKANASLAAAREDTERKHER